MSFNINIQIIDHSEQRYPTVGDWWRGQDGSLQIRVSKMSDWRYEVLVGVHELCEYVMCLYNGVTQESVDDFDMEFEARREPGNRDEPGDDVLAPYRLEHCIATGIERCLAGVLGVAWKDYELEIESL